MRALRHNSLSQIDWRRDPRPIGVAMQHAMDELQVIVDRRAMQALIGIYKIRARDMLNGDLPMRACTRAAGIVARWHRRFMNARRAA